MAPAESASESLLGTLICARPTTSYDVADETEGAEGADEQRHTRATGGQPRVLRIEERRELLHGGRRGWGGELAAAVVVELPVGEGLGEVAGGGGEVVAEAAGEPRRGRVDAAQLQPDVAP